MVSPPEVSPPALLRRLAGAASGLKNLSGLLLGKEASGTEDFQLRCLTFALLAGFITCAFFGGLVALTGEMAQAMVLIVTAVLFCLVIAVYRLSKQVSVALNATAAVTFPGIVAQMILQGGIHTRTSWWLITMSYLLATTGLHRSAVIWLGLSGLVILICLMLDALRLGPASKLGSAPSLFMFSAQFGLFVAGFGVGGA